MKLKCLDTAKANQVIQSVFSVTPNISHIGKTMYKIEDVTLSIYETKTVFFQGKNNPPIIEHIKKVLEL